MFPHPPTRSKVHISRSNIKLNSKKFPGTGKSIKDSEVKESKQTLSPIKDTNMKTRGSRKGRSSSKKEEEPSSSGATRTVEKRDSFSRYTPLPAIGTQDEKEHKRREQPKTSGKRSLPKSAEKHYPERSNTPSDEGLSDTIKRMRLGLDFGNSSLSEHLPLNETEEQISSNSLHQGKENTVINLIIRLPDGSKVSSKFKETDTLQKVLQFLSKQMKCTINLTRYILFLNEVPKKELKNVKYSLSRLSIRDRSVLALDTRD